jgi:hypothetical protein
MLIDTLRGYVSDDDQLGWGLLQWSRVVRVETATSGYGGGGGGGGRGGLGGGGFGGFLIYLPSNIFYVKSAAARTLPVAKLSSRC